MTLGRGAEGERGLRSDRPSSVAPKLRYEGQINDPQSLGLHPSRAGPSDSGVRREGPGRWLQGLLPLVGEPLREPLRCPGPRSAGPSAHAPRKPRAEGGVLGDDAVPHLLAALPVSPRGASSARGALKKDKGHKSAHWVGGHHGPTPVVLSLPPPCPR